jgi:hypothetical protein
VSVYVCINKLAQTAGYLQVLREKQHGHFGDQVLASGPSFPDALGTLSWHLDLYSQSGLPILDRIRDVCVVC